MKRLEMTDEEIMPGFLRASHQKRNRLTKYNEFRLFITLNSAFIKDKSLLPKLSVLFCHELHFGVETDTIMQTFLFLCLLLRRYISAHLLDAALLCGRKMRVFFR